jgi:hypothetical protein
MSCIRRGVTVRFPVSAGYKILRNPLLGGAEPGAPEGNPPIAERDGSHGCAAAVDVERRTGDKKLDRAS